MRFVHDVPDRSVLVRSAPHAVASVVAPTRVRRERRMSGAGVALWAEGAYVLGVDGAGRRVLEQPVPGAARSWLVGSLRGDGGPDGIWLSGVARHGRRVQVAFGPVGGPRVTAPRTPVAAPAEPAMPPPYTASAAGAVQIGAPSFTR